MLKSKILAGILLPFCMTAFAQHDVRDLAGAIVILGAANAIANSIQPQQRIYVQPPQRVYVYPQQYRQLRPTPLPSRVMTTYDPCYEFGQTVQTYDQYGHPMGYSICR